MAPPYRKDYCSDCQVNFPAVWVRCPECGGHPRPLREYYLYKVCNRCEVNFPATVRACPLCGVNPSFRMYGEQDIPATDPLSPQQQGHPDLASQQNRDSGHEPGQHDSPRHVSAPIDPLGNAHVSAPIDSIGNARLDQESSEQAEQPSNQPSYARHHSQDLAEGDLMTSDHHDFQTRCRLNPVAHPAAVAVEPGQPPTLPGTQSQDLPEGLNHSQGLLPVHTCAQNSTIEACRNVNPSTAASNPVRRVRFQDTSASSQGE